MAIKFSDAAQYAYVPNHVSQDFPNGDWALGFWLYVDSNAGAASQYVFNKGPFSGQPSTNVLIVEGEEPTNPNRIRLLFDDPAAAAADVFTPALNLAPGWHHFGSEHEDATNTTRILWDGVEVAAAASPIGAVSRAADLFVGGRNDGSGSISMNADRNFVGRLADVGKWSRRLSATEWANLANSASGVRARDLATSRDYLYEFEADGSSYAAGPPNATVVGATFEAGPFGSGDPPPPGSAPAVSITRPTATALAVPAGTELVLRATALGDGSVDLSAGISWTSSSAPDGTADGVPGRLGTGASLTIDTAAWADGARQITAAATDANGTGTDAFTLTVGAAAAASSSTPELRTMCDLYHRDPDAGRRRVPLYLTLADGTPAPAAAAQAKIIKNGGAGVDSGAAVAAIANAPAGWFAVQLTAAELDTPGSLVVAYDDGTARGRTLCAVLPLPAPVAGAVSAASSVTALTVPAGLRLRVGWVLSITEGAGEGGSAVVDSYNSATGAVVLEEPGLPVQPDGTSRFTATASPAGATMPLTDANGRVEVAGSVNRLDALPAPDNAGIGTLLARVPAEVATDADVQAISTALAGGVTLAVGQAAGIANALLDQADGVEANVTPRQALRLLTAILGGTVEGAGTSTETFRAAAGSKVRATVTADQQGNRTLTLDLSA
ncbi:MAG: LamG-like jellyroll fold domain-containing protein [Gemmatimonadota bacterium]